MESELIQQVDYTNIIHIFAMQQARKKNYNFVINLLYVFK